MIVAAEDTTTLSFEHQVDGLGDVGGLACSKNVGLHVHSVLLVSFETGYPIGLVDQQSWVREASTRGKRHQRYQRPYKEKESYKWERASRAMSQRLGQKSLSQVVSVCDREADIWEYLTYKVTNKQRFVVRATRTRSLVGSSKKLAQKTDDFSALGRVTIEVPQRGGAHSRKGRTAVLELKAGTLTLRSPNRKPGDELELSVVQATEMEAPTNKKPLSWLLLTSEAVGSLEEAVTVLDIYRLRWRIEDFHKAWKSGGTDIEGSRLKTASNIERLSSILSFIAVRILQLRDVKEHHPKAKVTEVLTELEWKILWAYTEKRKPPRKPPTLEWAYIKIAKMGAWSDTKRTGRAGWKALWRGWMKLESLIEGYKLSKQFEKADL